MITIHHLEYSQSFRILWLMEELGADYELKVYQRDPKTMLAPAEYKAVSPLGTSPVITDGDVTLAETSAIIDYILDTQGDTPLRPGPGAPNRRDYLFWFHTAQGSLMPALTMATIFGAMKSRTPFFMKPAVSPVVGMAEKAMVNPRMAALVQQIEDALSQRQWFAGDTLSAADIVMNYCMEAAVAKDFITKAHPHALSWIERVHARPAFKRAMEKDGTGSVVLKMS